MSLSAGDWVWEYLRHHRRVAIRELALAVHRPESTVRKAVRRLETKGFVRLDRRSRPYVVSRSAKSSWGT